MTTTALPVVDVAVDLSAEVPCDAPGPCPDPADYVIRARCCRLTNTCCAEHLQALAEGLDEMRRIVGLRTFQCGHCCTRFGATAGLLDLFTVESIR